MTENTNPIKQSTGTEKLSLDEIIQILDSTLEDVEENDKSIEGTREIVRIKTIQEEIFKLLKEKEGLGTPLTETQKAFCVKFIQENPEKEKTTSKWDLLIEGMIPTC